MKKSAYMYIINIRICTRIIRIRARQEFDIIIFTNFIIIFFSNLCMLLTIKEPNILLLTNIIWLDK